MANKRITPIAGENVVKELLAPETYMFWNPVDDSGHIRFVCYEYVRADGEFVARTGDAKFREVSFEEILMATYGTGMTDPVTGAPLDGVTGAGVLQLFKAMFDQIHNPSEDEEPEDPADPEEPTPEP